MITVTYYKSGSVGVQCPPGEALYALGMKPANHLPPAIRKQWWFGELRDTGCLYYSTNGLFEWLPN